MIVSSTDSNAGEVLMCDVAHLTGRPFQQSLVGSPQQVRDIARKLNDFAMDLSKSSLYFSNLAIAPQDKRPSLEDAWSGECIIRRVGQDEKGYVFAALCITRFQKSLVTNTELRATLAECFSPTTDSSPLSKRPRLSHLSSSVEGVHL